MVTFRKLEKSCHPRKEKRQQLAFNRSNRSWIIKEREVASPEPRNLLIP